MRNFGIAWILLLQPISAGVLMTDPLTLQRSKSFALSRRSAAPPTVRDSGLDHERFARVTGQLTHRAIAAIASLATTGDVAVPTYEAARAAAARVVAADPPRRGRHAARQRATFGALRYWREFMPAADSGFDLAGSEVALGHCRADLVWTRSRAPGLQPEFVIDEIKSAVWPNSPAVVSQVAALAAAGAAAYGRHFLGLRLLHLDGPGACFWITPEELWRPLTAAPVGLRGGER
jgi:hypothetical protein